MGMLRPLGNRLIVKPDPPDTASAGGIIFPQTHGQPPAMTGTVVSVGRGPASAHRVRQATIAQCAAAVTRALRQHANAARLARAALHDQARSADLSEVQEGDYVCFAFTAGHTMTVDGEAYVVLAEDDVQAVWTAEEQTA